VVTAILFKVDSEGAVTWIPTTYFGAPVSPHAPEKLGTKPSARYSSSVTPILVY